MRKQRPGRRADFRHHFLFQLIAFIFYFFLLLTFITSSSSLLHKTCSCRTAFSQKLLHGQSYSCFKNIQEFIKNKLKVNIFSFSLALRCDTHVVLSESYRTFNNHDFPPELETHRLKQAENSEHRNVYEIHLWDFQEHVKEKKIRAKLMKPRL